MAPCSGHGWSVLTRDGELAEKYCVEIYNRFSALREVDDSPDTNYGKFVKVNYQVAEDPGWLEWS